MLKYKIKKWKGIKGKGMNYSILINRSISISPRRSAIRIQQHDAPKERIENRVKVI